MNGKKYEGEYVCHVPPKLDDALVNELIPENVLALVRSVEEANDHVDVP